MNTLRLDDRTVKALEESNDIARKIGMHVAVIIMIDSFGIYTVRRGFFDEYGEADSYIYSMAKTCLEYGQPHLCFINGYMKRGGNIEKMQLEAK